MKNFNTAKYFNIFKANNSKNRDCETKNANFYRTYGDVSWEEAFNIWLSDISAFQSLKTKIIAFEEYLKAQNIDCVRSSKSESRYYSFNGVKYRFSAHVYPTGSMTDLEMRVVDLCADPHLIENVKF